MAPVIQLAFAGGGGVEHVCADRRFGQASEQFPVGERFPDADAGLRRCQRGVEDLHLRLRALVRGETAHVILQAGNRADTREQVEVFGECLYIALVLQVFRHFSVRQNLPGTSAVHLKQTFQQQRFSDAGERQHIAGDGDFHQGILYVARPARRFVNEGRGARIGAVEKILFQVPAEGPAHLGETPVRQVQFFQVPVNAFNRPAPRQQRRRAEQYHFHRPAVARVRVPEAFHRCRPARDSLYLVQYQQRAFVPGSARQTPRLRPLQPDPHSAGAQRRIIRAGKVERQLAALRHLPHKRRLAHLPRARYELNQLARLPDSPRQFGGLGSDECGFHGAGILLSGEIMFNTRGNTYTKTPFHIHIGPDTYTKTLFHIPIKAIHIQKRRFV